MKKSVLFLILLASVFSYGQRNIEMVSFNRLVEVVGTNNMIALEVTTNNIGDINSMSILFINTETGEGKIADIANEYIIQDFKQVRIDSLNINTVLVTARMYDLDLNGRINSKDPVTLLSVGLDGNSITIITPKTYNVRVWGINEKTGTITVAGYYDSNRNGRYDAVEKNEIQIYSLKTYKLIYKM